MEELAALAFFVGLALFAMARHARTCASHALDEPARKRLVSFLRRRPGVRLGTIWRNLGVSRGTARHHLLVLERVGMVQAVRAKGSTRYFPQAVEGTPLESISVLLRNRILEFASLLATHPGWCQQDFTTRLGIRRKTFRSWADLLLEHRLVEERKDKFRKRYFPTEELERVLPMAQRSHEAASESVDVCGPGRPRA